MENKKTQESTTQLVNFKIDPVVKESADSVLSGMGLNMSAYIGMCLRKLAQDRSVPFELSVDADFWAKETVVSNVMRIINSGAFDSICALRETVKCQLIDIYKIERTKMFNKMCDIVSESDSSEEDEDSDDHMPRFIELNAKRKQINVIAYYIAQSMDDYNDESLFKEQIDDIDSLVYKIENVEDPTNTFNIQGLVKMFKEMNDLIKDLCNSFFDTEESLKEFLTKSRSSYNFEERIQLIDKLYIQPINVYQDLGPQFTIRFIGANNDSEALVRIKTESKRWEEVKKHRETREERARKREDELLQNNDRINQETWKELNRFNDLTKC